ncbi:hypothetical protein [Helcococcus kunzii]|uniref:hypothetical protein n=1 Tax=Helcococcus kunzii TaxID=40091 RepID=UPI00389EA0BB
MSELRIRPCLVNGKKALFHKWIESKYFVEPSPMVGGTIGGQICNNFAIVEYDDGSVSVCKPENIVFLDMDMGRYKMSKVDELTLEYLNNCNLIDFLEQKKKDKIMTDNDEKRLNQLKNDNNKIKKTIKNMLER